MEKMEKTAMERSGINAFTDLFGVFGNPVKHSLGPVMHSRAFFESEINAVYLAFEITEIQRGLNAVRELGIKGVSVTIPFKEAVIPYLDHVDPLATRMGAVNTVVNQDGVLTGFNTDCDGAVLPLKQEIQLKGKCACILGAGGAARALAFGLKEEGVHVTIANRSTLKGQALARAVDGVFLPLSADFEWDGDIWINATSVGMTPMVDSTPLDKKCFRPGQIVMDIVYNPVLTRFLKEAREAGCKTIDGLSMFVCQGAAQFTLFTGRPAPRDAMMAAVVSMAN